MSTIVGFNLSDFVVLAVDSRSLCFNGAGELVKVDDTTKKVYSGPGGYMVSAGDHFFSEAVGEAFEATNVRTIPELDRLIARARRSVFEERGGKPHYEQDMKATSLAFTAVIDGAVRLLLYSGAHKLDGLCGQIRHGDAMVIAPYGSPDDTDRKLQAILRSRIRPQCESLAVSVRYHAALASSVMSEISRHTKVVSPHGHGVFHAVTGERRIQPFKADPVLSSSARDSELADEISALMMAA